MRTALRLSILACLAVGVIAFAVSSRASARTVAQRLESGRKIYAASCSMCHGDQGRGDGPLANELLKETGSVPARLTEPALISALGRDGVRRVIVEGGGHRTTSTLMPDWGQKLKPSLADDVTDYVMSLPGQNPQIPAATLDQYLKAPRGSSKEGKALYVYYCSGCHGLSAKGDGIYAPTLRTRHNVWPRNLTETAYFATKTDRDLFMVVSLGGGHIGKSKMMPAWNVNLTPEQIQHLVAYVRAVSRTKSRP